MKIEHLNDFGLGVINTPQDKIFVLYSLPGEEVIIDNICSHRKYKTANLVSVTEASKSRIAPPCQYFGQCGGCQLQHMKEDFYQEFKINLVSKALGSLKQDPKLLSTTVFSKYGQRRRTTLRAYFKDNVLVLGYFAYHAHQLVNIEHCLLLNAELNAVITRIREALQGFSSQSLSCADPLEIAITSCNNGFDLSFRSQYPLKEKEQQLINALPQDIIRIYWQNNDNFQMLREVATPLISIDGEEIAIPPNAFLQVSEESQNSIVQFILSKLSNHSNILDLFAGIGTYSIPLSKHARIHAVEGENHLLKHLKAHGNISVECRDLQLAPLDRGVLNKFDLVVINPPRNGATKQITNLAESTVRDLILVYCDLQSFKRDCKILLDARWKLADVAMVDQFYQSYHVEVVGHLQKK